MDQSDAGKKSIDPVEEGQRFDSMQQGTLSKGRMFMPTDAEYEVRKHDKATCEIEPTDDFSNVGRIIQPTFGFLGLPCFLAHVFF